MADIERITTAMKIVNLVEEMIFAEAKMMQGRITDVEEMVRELADATTQHDDISANTKAVVEYMRKLRKMMVDAELPSINETVALEQAEKMESESLDIVADLEGAQGFLSLALVMMKDGAAKAETMSGHAKELVTQMTVVMERP